MSQGCAAPPQAHAELLSGAFGTPTPFGTAPAVGTFPIPGWPEPRVSVVLTPSCQVVSARAVWPEARGSHRGFPQHTPAPDGGLCCSHGHSSGPRERTATGCHVLCQSRCKRYASRAGAPSGLPWVFVAGVPGTAPPPSGWAAVALVGSGPPALALPNTTHTACPFCVLKVEFFLEPDTAVLV